MSEYRHATSGMADTAEKERNELDWTFAIVYISIEYLDGMMCCTQTAHTDADSAALALSAIAPDGVKQFRTEKMHLS